MSTMRSDLPKVQNDCIANGAYEWISHSATLF
jgi:hypothetical protein